MLKPFLHGMFLLIFQNLVLTNVEAESSKSKPFNLQSFLGVVLFRCSKQGLQLGSQILIEPKFQPDDPP